MPALNQLYHRMMAVPNMPERSKHLQNTQGGHCDRTCTIVLATVFPIVFISLILIIVYLSWGRERLQRRRREREEKDAERRKVGDEESMTSNSDVSSLDGEVLRMNEQRAEELGRREEGRREETRRERVEEGHEHDHVLAMIGARP